MIRLWHIFINVDESRPTKIIFNSEYTVFYVKLGVKQILHSVSLQHEHNVCNIDAVYNKFTDIRNNQWKWSLLQNLSYVHKWNLKLPSLFIN